MKYSFIMPYYDRADQLEKTLSSLVDFYSRRTDFEVIIVEDAKNAADPKMTEGLGNIIDKFNLIIPVFKIKYRQIKYNPAPMFNLGSFVASGKYLVITNPECRHDSDILAGLDDEFTQDPEVYVICACQSLHFNGVFHRWYQHTQHRDARYHFCSALSADLYSQVGRFDEKYADGYGYDDNAFRDKLIRAQVRFSCRDDLVVSHQAHKKCRPPDYRRLLEKNRKLYEQERRA